MKNGLGGGPVHVMGEDIRSLKSHRIVLRRIIPHSVLCGVKAPGSFLLQATHLSVLRPLRRHIRR